MTDWSVHEEVARSLRRLNRAAAGHHAADDELRALARAASALAERLEAGRARDKEAEMAELMWRPGTVAGAGP